MKKISLTKNDLFSLELECHLSMQFSVISWNLLRCLPYFCDPAYSYFFKYAVLNIISHVILFSFNS